MTLTDDPEVAGAREALATAIATQGITTVWQPIVDLETGHPVAFEALSRGPRGSSLEMPDALFGVARDVAMLSELDDACRRAAFRSAAALDLSGPWTVFVNVEPEVLDAAPLEDLRAIADDVPTGLRVVLEITERALAARPAELLQTVRRVRDLGWGIALDDVGAHPASLTFMALLRPDVVKLDMALVQDAPSVATAEVMHAVSSYAESSGALVLAEGIETARHLAAARALGAVLGQGWMYGRPEAEPVRSNGPAEPLQLLPTATHPDVPLASPFSALPTTTPLRRSTKRLLIELSKNLEREAGRLGATCLVASTFQYAHNFTPATVQRYQRLVGRVGFVCVLGEGLHQPRIEGLRGASLASDDPIIGEWDVIVLSPHFSAALLARDLGDGGPELERRFDYALTYRRDTVVAAAHDLLLRVAPEVVPGQSRA